MTASANSGYELDSISARTSNDGNVTLSNQGNGRYTFTMPAANVTVSVSFKRIQTSEPSTTIPTTPPKPSIPIQVLEPPTTSNPFTDVAESAYYYDAVLWALDNGITNGKTATTFEPTDSCTRAQTVTFLWRAANSPEPLSRNNPFVDVSSDSYYYKAVLWAVEQGITNGTTATTFSPNNTVSRGQVVTFLYRSAKANPGTNRNSL